MGVCNNIPIIWFAVWRSIANDTRWVGSLGIAFALVARTPQTFSQKVSCAMSVVTL